MCLLFLLFLEPKFTPASSGKALTKFVIADTAERTSASVTVYGVLRSSPVSWPPAGENADGHVAANGRPQEISFLPCAFPAHR